MIFIKIYSWLFFLIQNAAHIPTELKVNQKFIVQRHSALVFPADTTNMNNDKASDEGVFVMQISPWGEDCGYHEFISQFSFFSREPLWWDRLCPFSTGKWTSSGSQHNWLASFSHPSRQCLRTPDPRGDRHLLLWWSKWAALLHCGAV